jgi:hypothetical protein
VTPAQSAECRVQSEEARISAVFVLQSAFIVLRSPPKTKAAAPARGRL